MVKWAGAGQPHTSWGYDGSVPTGYNTLSDVITIDKDYGQAVYPPGAKNLVNTYNLLIANGVANKQEAELDLNCYSASGKTGVFVAVYMIAVIGFFDKIAVTVGHSYARKIAMDKARNQIVFTLTDLTTMQTQVIMTPLKAGSTNAPFDGLDVGVEYWDNSGRPNVGPFQSQVDATITNLMVDGRIYNPNIPRFTQPHPSLKPFTVMNGSYQIRGMNPLAMPMPTMMPPTAMAMKIPDIYILGGFVVVALIGWAIFR